jgi:hypothetical protein
LEHSFTEYGAKPEYCAAQLSLTDTSYPQLKVE